MATPSSPAKPPSAVTVEQAAARAPASSPASDADATPQQRLLALLRNDYQPLYAILDAARDIKILALLMQSKEEHQSLYEGVQGAKLSQVAPYLVRLRQGLASARLAGAGRLGQQLGSLPDLRQRVSGSAAAPAALS